MTEAIRNRRKSLGCVNIVNIVKQIRCYWESFAMRALTLQMQSAQKAPFWFTEVHNVHRGNKWKK
jgi:hypothetical protein